MLYGGEVQYNFYYCTIKLHKAWHLLRNDSFTINGVKYVWVNLNELKENKEVKKYNYDILEFLSKKFDLTLIDLDNSFCELIFVITAFHPKMEPIFQGIKAAGDAYGDVVRVTEVEGDYMITPTILELIGDARLIVADLTHERPNVYFELGYARGLGKTVVTVAREETTIHFDVKDWRCYFYSDSRDIEEQLKKKFASVFRRTI